MYHIDEAHENLLRTALNLSEEQQLPSDVVELYWEFARTAHRINSLITPEMLVSIIVLAGRSVPEKPASILDSISDLEINARILAKFRNKWRWGRFQMYDKNEGKVIVQLDDGTSENRKFRPTSVRLPTREELQEIGE